MKSNKSASLDVNAGASRRFVLVPIRRPPFTGSSEQALAWFKRTKHEHTGIAVAAFGCPKKDTLPIIDEGTLQKPCSWRLRAVGFEGGRHEIVTAADAHTSVASPAIAKQIAKPRNEKARLRVAAPHPLRPRTGSSPGRRGRTGSERAPPPPFLLSR
jgi:hypothetical protein